MEGGTPLRASSKAKGVALSADKGNISWSLYAENISVSPGNANYAFDPQQKFLCSNALHGARQEVHICPGKETPSCITSRKLYIVTGAAPSVMLIENALESALKRKTNSEILFPPFK